KRADLPSAWTSSVETRVVEASDGVRSTYATQVPDPQFNRHNPGVPPWSPGVVPCLWRAVGAADAVHIHYTFHPAHWTDRVSQSVAVCTRATGNGLFAANILRHADRVRLISAGLDAAAYSARPGD